jgi:hypothetical protein
MKLFQTQKNLLTEVVRWPAGGLVKSANPADPSQYLAVKTNGKNLQIVLTSQEISVKVVIDKAGDLLKVHTDGTFVLKGDILKEILQRSAGDVSDVVNIDFDESSAGEMLKGETPEHAPVALLGNAIMSWSNNLLGKEEWAIPVIDTNSIDVPTNPTFDLKGADRLIVKAGDFAKYIRQVGIAVGKDLGDAKYRNVMIRTSKMLYEIVATNQIMLAVVKSQANSDAGSFLMTIPYSQAFLASRLLNPELNVEIIYNKGNPGTAVLTQEVVYGEQVIGTVYFRITCSNEPFAKFDKTINDLSFRNSCKMKTQRILPVCTKLDIFQPARTAVILDKKQSALIFSKKEAGRGASKGLVVEIYDIKGDNFDFDVSSMFLTQSVNNAEADEILWQFSGKEALSRMDLSPSLTAYFPLMGQKDEA